MAEKGEQIIPNATTNTSDCKKIPFHLGKLHNFYVFTHTEVSAISNFRIYSMLIKRKINKNGEPCLLSII